MRWNMESDFKEASLRKMKESTITCKFQDHHVVTTLMQAYLAVTNSTSTQDLKNTAFLDRK